MEPWARGLQAGVDEVGIGPLAGPVYAAAVILNPPIGMKLFATEEEMASVPRIRRPDDIHTTDQIVGQASRNGWTVGITAKDLVGAQCSTVIGLHPRSEEWLSGERMTGVWYGTAEDAAAHQAAMDVVPAGNFQAMGISIRNISQG